VTELRDGTPKEAGMSAARVEHVKGLARGWVEDGTHPALVVLAARRGVIFMHEAFGTLRPGEGPALPPDAIFPIFSATKPITAACVLLLVEEGRVGLMRSVRDYFPEISAEGAQDVLIHHLLSHLSGWRDIDVAREGTRRAAEGGERPAPEPGQHPDIAQFLHVTSSTPLACPPGEAMQYCQLNYELLAEIVRRVSGLSIERFARERIFEPLGMSDSSYVLPAEHRERKVRRSEGMPGTQFGGRLFPGVDAERFEGQPSGAGGMHTTARDYATFAQMLLNNGTYGGRRVLSPASVQAMRRNQVPAGVPMRWVRPGPDGEPVTWEFSGGYGYGLAPFADSVTAYYNGGLASPSSFSHSGNFGTYWWADPERDLVGVYLSVAARYRDDGVTLDRRSDLFVDALTAAVDE
jgi:CubicO group peptidase (beta-lactamase class C family)